MNIKRTNLNNGILFESDNIDIKAIIYNYGYTINITHKKDLKDPKSFLNYSAGYIFTAPTSNCQLCSLASLNCLLDSYKQISGKNIEHGKELFKLYFLAISQLVGKPIALIDLNSSYFDTFIKFPHVSESFILTNPYKSTNNSNMVLGLLNMHTLLDLSESK